MSEENQDQKLKDLEQSLAEELGTSAESKPGSTANETVAIEDTEEASKELSNEEVDAILKDKDPEFAASLDQLKKDLDETTKDINISEAVPTDMPSADSTEANSVEFVPFSKKLKDPKQLLLMVKTLAKKTVSFISFMFLTAKALTSGISSRLSNLNRLQKLQLFALILLVVITSLFAHLVITRQTFSFTKKDKYLTSFEAVADQIISIEKDAEWEEFKNSLRDPEYIVLIKKMIVNLKPTARSTSKPMAAFELYIETSSKESAVEVKDRELEFRDHIARVFESLPYDDIVDAQGKEKLKLFIRSELNKVINNGRVKKVYFKTLFYKR